MHNNIIGLCAAYYSEIETFQTLTIIIDFVFRNDTID